MRDVTHVLEKENDESNIDLFFRSSILRLDGLNCPERLCASAAMAETSSSSLEISSSSSNQALCKDFLRRVLRTADPPIVRRLTLPMELQVMAVSVSLLSLSEELQTMIPLRFEEIIPLRLEEREMNVVAGEQTGGLRIASCTKASVRSVALI